MPTPDPLHDPLADRTPAKPPAGGGFFFVVALLAGIVGGVVMGQPSIGFLAGAAAGAAILLGMWLYARR